LKRKERAAVPLILIVEDDPVTSLVYQRLLEHTGYEITLASSGLAAIELLETHEVHAVVTDLVMPRMDGKELCEQIRADERWIDLPIFVATGVDEAGALAWLDHYSNIQLLEKPIQVAELIEALDELPLKDEPC
jgi:CheY-like chemotaxis protein